MSEVKMERYHCPYCDWDSVSPGGIRWHVSVEHPDKMEEFMEKYYPEMAKRFQEAMEKR